MTRITRVGAGRVLLVTGLDETTPDPATVAVLTAAQGASVAAISGHCAGPAFELALACDLRIAADTATFSAADVADVAACARRLARLLGEARAKDVLLTGRRFTAGDALRLGVVTRVVPAAQLATEALSIAEMIASHPPHAVQATRAAIERVRELGPAAALAEEQDHCERLLGSRDPRQAVAPRRAPLVGGA